MVKKCVSLTDNEHFFIDLLIHISVLSLILVVFFVFVVSILERTAINSKIKDAINKALNSYNPPANPTAKAELEEVSDVFDKLETDSADKIYNTSLFYYSILFLMLLVISTVLTYVLLKYSANRCINIWKLFFFNLLVFSCVGVMETVFFLEIAMHFIPVKPSYMIELINKKL